MANPPPPVTAYPAMHSRVGYVDGSPLTEALLDAMAADLLAQDGSGNVQEIISMRVGPSAFLIADPSGNAWLSFNAYYDTGTSSWYPNNSASASYALEVTATGINLNYSAAVGGAGAMTWTVLDTFATAGTSISGLLAAISAETTRAEAAEATNATAVTTEATARAAGDATNATAISTETTRATTAENLKAPLASPTFTGVPAAPTAAALTNTTQLATTAFTTAAVGVETTRATTAEAAEATARASAITSEASTRATADTTLQTNITAEAATRASADTTNATAITTEATARAAADVVLQTNINAVLPATDSNYEDVTVDAAGNVITGYRNGDFETLYGGPSSHAVARELSEQAEALSRSLLERPHNLKVGLLLSAYNMFISDGQSLSNGRQSKQLSLTAEPNAFMIGTSVRPNSASNPAFVPIGSSALTPMVATTEPIGAGPRTSYTQLQVNALSIYNDNFEGETPIIAASNHIARTMQVTPGYTSAKTVTSCCGVGGQYITALRKGASPNLYARCTDAISLFSSLTGAGNYVSAIYFDDGQADYSGGTGSTQDTADWVTQITGLFNELNTDCKSLTGATFNPAWFIVPTSGHWVRDDQYDLGVTMAQVQFCQNTPGAWLVGPSYAYPDCGDYTPATLNFQDHLVDNASVWQGANAGKVMRHVLIDKKHWEPLNVWKVVQHGLWIYVACIVPKPPLQIKSIYVRFEDTTLPTYGITIKDGYGNVDIDTIQLIGSCVIAIKTKRKAGNISGDGAVWIGDQTDSIGGTNICDSDTTTVGEVYQFGAWSDSRENQGSLAALIGKNLSLNNWLVPGVYALNYTRTF